MNEDYFNFDIKTEEQEELDFRRLRNCPHCKKPIPHNAIMCFYCGEEVHVSKKPRWLILSVIMLLVVFVIFVLWRVFPKILP